MNQPLAHDALMQLPDFKEGETVVFSSPPAKDIKKLLSFLKIDFVVRRLPPELGRSEILVCGGGIHGLGAALSRLAGGAQVEHVIPKPDFSQQLWVYGDYSLRLVLWAEDLFQELATSKHRLCIIDGAHPVALRTGTEEFIRLVRKTGTYAGLTADRLKTLHCQRVGFGACPDQPGYEVCIHLPYEGPGHISGRPRTVSKVPGGDQGHGQDGLSGKPEVFVGIGAHTLCTKIFNGLTITGSNAGGPRQIQIRTPLTAHVGQF